MWLTAVATMGPPSSKPAAAARLSHLGRREKAAKGASSLAANSSPCTPAAVSQPVPVQPRRFVPPDGSDGFFSSRGDRAGSIAVVSRPGPGAVPDAANEKASRRWDMPPSPPPPPPSLDMHLEPSSKESVPPLPGREDAAFPKQWWEAHHLALPVCTLAGGPPMARHLAAASRGLCHAVNEAWGDLARRFPCRLYVVGGIDGGYKPLESVVRFDPLAGAWEALPPLATARAGAAAAVVAGRLYVLGGEACGRALRDAHRFDPWTGAWERLPSMQVGRIRAGAVALGGYLYVFGGLDGARPLTSTERYCPRTRRWQALAAMQRPRYACATAARDGCVYVFGGDLMDPGMCASSERYDPEAGLWELVLSVRAPACGAAVAMVAGSAYTLGGLGLSGQALCIAERVCVSDVRGKSNISAAADLGGLGEGSLPILVTESRDEDTPAVPDEEHEVPWEPAAWDMLPPMPTARHLASAATFHGAIVAVGGKGPSFEAMREVELYDPKLGKWQVLPPLPEPRIRAAVVSGRL